MEYQPAKNGHQNWLSKKYAYFFIFFQLDDVNHMTNIPPFEKKNNFFQMRFLIIVQSDIVVHIMG